MASKIFPFPFSCATAYILLAEEEATTILEAEKYFKQALRAGETVYKKSQHSSSQNPHHEAQLSKYCYANCLKSVDLRLVLL